MEFPGERSTENRRLLFSPEPAVNRINSTIVGIPQEISYISRLQQQKKPKCMPWYSIWMRNQVPIHEPSHSAETKKKKFHSFRYLATNIENFLQQEEIIFTWIRCHTHCHASREKTGAIISTKLRSSKQWTLTKRHSSKCKCKWKKKSQ